MPSEPDLSENTSSPNAAKACRHCPPLERCGSVKKQVALGVGMPSGDSFSYSVVSSAPEWVVPYVILR
jgi:hypothetical protein